MTNYLGNTQLATLIPYLVIGGFLLFALFALVLLNKQRQVKAPNAPAAITQTAPIPTRSDPLEEINATLSAETARAELSQRLSHHLMADLCGFIAQLPGQEVFTLQVVYDLIQQEHLGTASLPFSMVPGMVYAFQTRIPLICNTPSEHLIDRASLRQATRYNKLGNFMVYPLSQKAEPYLGVVCCSPYTNKEFGLAEVEQLESMKPRIRQIWQESVRDQARAMGLGSLRTKLQGIAGEKAAVTGSLRRTRVFLESKKANGADQRPGLQAKIAEWLKIQDQLEDEIVLLNETITQKNDIATEFAGHLPDRAALEAAISAGEEHLARMHTSLAHANDLVNAYTASPRMQGETAPIALGLSQAEEAAPLTFRDVIANHSLNCTRKGIQLNANWDSLPEDLCSASHSAHTVLDLMQQNAIAASPNKGKVDVQVFKTETEGGQLEMRITDLGGGLSQMEQAHFLRFVRNNNFPVPAGIGDAAALRKATQLVSEAGGHLWIHSEKDKPTTYRITLPLRVEGAKNMV